MGFRIVIAGESQCQSFAESCLVADFLNQNLPDFCYDRIEISVLDWQTWLCNINLKNKWHHVGSPLVWKELLMSGSKPYYIGGGPEFLDYCYSYYHFDSLFASYKYGDLIKNSSQFKTKVATEKRHQEEENARAPVEEDQFVKNPKKQFIVTISGVRDQLALHLITGLLELDMKYQAISKIYLYDDSCSVEFMLHLEKECANIESSQSGKVVKYVNKIGTALTSTDLLIILDHAPLKEDMGIGEWLYANKKIMERLSLMINASGARTMYIVLPNVGPACYNATLLRRKVTIIKDHIVVVTSDLGLEILPIAAEIAEVQSRNIFCPPVWGFVGINHLVDIRTTIHRYDTFQPYSRFTKVTKSTLKIGSITPELRTMEYLMFFDESLWQKVADTKHLYPKKQPWLNKSIVVLNLVKLWLFHANPTDIINLGLHCNGSFGLTFDGIFSQPARLKNGIWVPATDFLLPKDRNLTIYYLEKMAKYVMGLDKDALPPIVPIQICSCKQRHYKKRGGKRQNSDKASRLEP